MTELEAKAFFAMLQNIQKRLIWIEVGVGLTIAFVVAPIVLRRLGLPSW